MSLVRSRFLCVLALAAVAGCGRRAAAPPGTPVAEADPIHDTIGEFRRSERIACAEGTDLVYVVARDGTLHSFDPGELRFRRIGRLECPGTGRSLPQSMAVDRSGQAWVGYDNGALGRRREPHPEARPNMCRMHVDARRDALPGGDAGEPEPHP